MERESKDEEVPLLPGQADEPAHAILAPLVPLALGRRPRSPPPPDAFGDLPDGFEVLDAARAASRGRKIRSPSEIAEDEARKAAAAEAAMQAAFAEAEAKAAAARAAVHAARPLPVEEPKAPAAVVEDRSGSARGKKGAFAPPPPPMPPPVPAVIVTGVVPRGVMTLKLQRVVGVGVGPGCGALASRINRYTAGSAYIKWELALGGGQATGLEEGNGAPRLSKVVRMASKTAVFRDVVLSDWMPGDPSVKVGGSKKTGKGADAASLPPPAADLTADDPQMALDAEDAALRHDPAVSVFEYVEGVASVQAPHGMVAEDAARLPPLLFYSVWWTGGGGFLSMKGDELIGEGCVPASSFFVKRLDRWTDICLPINGPGDPPVKAGRAPYVPLTPHSYLLAAVRFRPSMSGILAITLHDGRGWRDVEQIASGVIDPYVKMELGSAVPIKSQVIAEGGTDPAFGDQEMLMWVDHATFNRRPNVTLSGWDSNTLTKDVVIGRTAMPLHAWTRSADQRSELLTLCDENGTESGILSITRKWHPAGELSVRVVAGRKLAATDAMGGNDTYVKLTVAGRVRSFAVRTATTADGGCDPVFLEQFVFDVVDQSEMIVNVMDYDRFSKDDVVGDVVVELLPVYRYGIRDAWVPLKKRGDWGGYDDRGELRLEIDFMGPPGVAFPQLRTDVATFGDKERNGRHGLSADARDAALDMERQKAAVVEKERIAAMKEMSGEMYTDTDIEEAFKKLDLDGNLVLSHAELRHALHCMGELVTTREVDEMVDMLDKDGDGSVAFYEFYQMAKAAPAVLGTKAWRPISESKLEEVTRKEGDIAAPPVIVYGPNGQPVAVMDATLDAAARKKAVMRSHELARKKIKKQLCMAVVEREALRLPELQRVHKRCKSSKQFNESGHLTYKEMLEVFDVNDEPEEQSVRPKSAAVEPLNVWKELYGAFTRGGSDPNAGKVNVREVLLSLNNFTGATRPQRVNYSFALFDTDNSGELSFEEILEILKANHMVSDNDAVLKKAEVILAAADRDGSRSLSLEEFVVVASRFPNVLFPNFDVAHDDALAGLPSGDAEPAPASVAAALLTKEAAKAARATDEQVEARVA
jgi:Ca2+-binding EF-hand superfamily protein